MTIRSIETNDIPELLDMTSVLWPGSEESELLSDIQQVLVSSREEGIVYENADGNIAGFAFLSVRSDYVEGAKSKNVGYLEAIFIKEEFRKNKIGASLVAAAEEWCRQQGCVEMGSDTEIGNVRSQQFHLNV